MPTEYPADFKQKVIKRYQNGESIKSLSHELHIAQGTLYRWRKAYCTIQGTTRTYTPKEFDAISRRLAKLEHEMEIIRLSQCIAYPCRFDISQRPRQAVYFHRIYNAPAKVRCEAIVFRYGTAT